MYVVRCNNMLPSTKTADSPPLRLSPTQLHLFLNAMKHLSIIATIVITVTGYACIESMSLVGQGYTGTPPHILFVWGFFPHRLLAPRRGFVNIDDDDDGSYSTMNDTE